MNLPALNRVGTFTGQGGGLAPLDLVDELTGEDESALETM